MGWKWWEAQGESHGSGIIGYKCSQGSILRTLKISGGQSISAYKNHLKSHPLHLVVMLGAI